LTLEIRLLWDVLAATLFAHGPAPLGDHGSATVREDAHQT